MSNRTNAYFTFNPTSMINPPTNGFVAGNFIHANEVNGISYASFNFVNSFINSLVSNSKLEDGETYTYNGTNLSTLISEDINSWIDYRIESVEHSTMTFKYNTTNTTSLTGSVVSTSYTETNILGKLINNSSKMKYDSLSIDKEVTSDSTLPTWITTTDSFSIKYDSIKPYIEYSNTSKSILGTTKKNYKIFYPKEIANINGLDLNSVQSLVKSYISKPTTSDIATFIKENPTIRVLGCATMGVKNSGTTSIYCYNTWQVSSVSDTLVFYRSKITKGGTSYNYTTKVSESMSDDFDDYGLTTGRDSYYEILYFC